LNGLRRAAQRRLRAWAARRFGQDALPHVIGRRRIYILPTRFGLVLALMIVAMLIASLNYNNNLALGFAFLMASVVLVGMHHCHRNLLGLSVDTGGDCDTFAGMPAALEFVLANPSGIDRYDIEIRCSDAATATAAVRAAHRSPVTVALPTAGRGRSELPQFELATRYPFGWFRAWTYVQSPLVIYAAPAPQGRRLPPSARTNLGDAASAESSGEEDWAGLRAYVPGMPLKHMAWKTLARGREAAVRHYTSAAAAPEWLEWSLLEGVEAEERLSQLCRWVLDADAAHRAYGLRLPGIEIAPALGTAHRLACLRALATCE
jgi:uncharacterized protein (DUF58 family)